MPQLPYSPQPSFPPLPRRISEGVEQPFQLQDVSLLRNSAGFARNGRGTAFGDAAYSKSAPFGAPDALSALDLAMRDAVGMPVTQEEKRSKKRALLLQDLVKPSVDCPRCRELEDKLQEDKKNYFLEIEHLRRGIQKCLDQLAAYMSQTALNQFRATLQLDVRFLSKSDEDESGRSGLSPTSGSPAGPREDPRLAAMKERIKSLMEEIEYLKERMAQLQERLNNTGGGGGGGTGGGGGPRVSVARASTRNTFTQTDAEPMQAHAGVPGAPGPYGVGPHGQPGQPGHHGGHPSGPPQPGGGGGARAGATAGATSGPHGVKGSSHAGGGGVDPAIVEGLREEIERLKGERDLASMKLSKAEREVKELKDKLKAKDKEVVKDDSSAEIEELKQSLEKAEARIQELMELLDKTGKGGGKGPQEGRRGLGRSLPGADPKKAPGLKQDAPREASGKSGSSPSHGMSEHHREKHHAANGGRRSSNFDLRGPDREVKPKVEMVDKCVGGGPPQPEDDEPILLRGKSAKPKEPEKLNKMGTTHLKSVRSSTNLGVLGGSSSRELFNVVQRAMSQGSISRKPSMSTGSNLGVTLKPGMAKAGVTWHAGEGAGVLPQKKFTATRPSGGAEPEPYIEDVWEHHPHASSDSMRQELVKLGAVKPQSASGPPPARKPPVKKPTFASTAPATTDTSPPSAPPALASSVPTPASDAFMTASTAEASPGDAGPAPGPYGRPDAGPGTPPLASTLVEAAAVAG